MKKTLLIVIAILGLHKAFATTYYSRVGGSVLTLANWNTLSSGTGGTNPANFSLGDIFIIQSGNTMTTPAAWTVSGTGSGLQIQTGGALTMTNAVSVVDFTLAGGTITAGAALSVSGNWTNNGGTFNNNANTVTFNGTNQEVAGTANTTFGSVTVSSGCTLLGTKFLLCQQAFKLLGTGYFIQVLGTAFPANGAKTIDPTTTYEYRGAAASSWPGVSGLSFGNLIVNATGTVSCGTNLTIVKGNLVVKSNLNLMQGASAITITGNLEVDLGILNFNTVSGVATVNVNGNVILNGGTLNPQPSTSAPSFNVKGNWTTNAGAIYTPGTTTVTFNGSAAQTIDGAAATNFYSLALSTVNGTGNLSLSNNISIANLLTLNSRKITTGSNTVTIGGSGAAISRSSGWVNGNLAKTTNSGSSASYTYAIGDASNYTPVALTFTNNATATGMLTINTTGTEHPQIGSSGINSNKDANRYWSMANSGLAFTGTYAAVFTFVSGDVDAGANTAAFGAYDYSSSNWSATATGTKTSTTTQATGITGFGDFAIGEVCLSIGNFSTSASSVCLGSGSTITVNSTSLTNGSTYTLTYNLSGANSATANAASLTLSSGTGTFNTTALANDGSTTIAITAISGTAGCGVSIGAGNTAVFTVNNLSTLSGASQTGTAIVGTGALINLAGLLPGSTSAINYTINGVAQTPIANIVADNTGAASFTSSNLTAANNGQTLQITGIVSGSNCPQSFTQNIILVVKSTITWTGAQDVFWNNAANWSSGTLPTANTDIVIPSGMPNYPNLNTTGIASVKSLTIQAGATLTVSNASELDIYGIVTVPQQSALTVIGLGSKVHVIKVN